MISGGPIGKEATLSETSEWRLLLTPRERTVVSLIGQGYETAAIARELVISPETVRTHVRNAMSKAGARTRAQLVAASYVAT
jgi:DNA-binding NarL/FixJ family response regulator